MTMNYPLDAIDFVRHTHRQKDGGRKRERERERERDSRTHTKQQNCSTKINIRFARRLRSKYKETSPFPRQERKRLRQDSIIGASRGSKNQADYSFV